MIKYFLSFDKLIGTKLIKGLYFLGLIGIGLGVIASFFAGLSLMRASFFGGLWAIVIGVFAGLIAVIVWRFLCELYMLFFRMSDDLRDIKNHQMGLSPNKTDVDIDL